MSNKFDRVISLIKRTGDKIVVVDEKAEPQFVMMNIEEYEKLLAFKNDNVTCLTEDELLSKINRDIAIWKSEQKDQEIDSGSKMEISDSLSDESQVITQEDQQDGKKEDKEKYYFEPIDEDEEDFYELND